MIGAAPELASAAAAYQDGVPDVDHAFPKRRVKVVGRNLLHCLWLLVDGADVEPEKKWLLAPDGAFPERADNVSKVVLPRVRNEPVREPDNRPTPLAPAAVLG